MTRAAGLDQVEARSPNLHPGFPHGGRDSRTWLSSVSFPGVLAENCIETGGTGNQTSSLILKAGIPSGSPTHGTTMLK